jgi:spoIIIJ-associated protein
VALKNGPIKYMAENKNSKLIKKFFENLGLDTKFELDETEEAYSIILDTEDSGIIIGYHGETLEALQIVLSLMLAKTNEVFKRVSIEVGDYKKNREAWLEKLAFDAKDKAIFGKKEVYLTELKAWERRVVHMILQDDEEVVTESTGEGRDRMLVVKPR